MGGVGDLVVGFVCGFVSCLVVVSLLCVVYGVGCVGGFSGVGGSRGVFEDKLREARRLLVEARESTGCSWCRRRVDELVGAVEALERIGVKAEEVAREYMSSPLSRVGEIRAEAEEVASRGGW